MPGIAGFVPAGEGSEVLREAGRVIPQRAKSPRRKRFADRHRPALSRRDRLAILAQDREFIARDRKASTAALAAQIAQRKAGRDPRPTELGLPPVIDHRQAAVLFQPGDRIGIGAFAGEENHPAITGADFLQEPRLGIFLADRADCGWRGEKAFDAVTINDPPERPGIGSANRLALEQHRGRARNQRAIDDVAVANHPADVAGRPERIARANPIDVGH